ncbi:MAG: MarR family winged helix-turn-helix transcriptional regulator, partial [Negativibacillus sp.]
MKDVLGAFNQLQKAYRKYCYQAVAPLGIKMSEMLCILYLYNFPNEDTAHAIAQYSQLSAGMVSKSLESLRQAGYVRSERDEQDNRIYHLYLTEQAQELVKRLRAAQSYF